MMSCGFTGLMITVARSDVSNEVLSRVNEAKLQTTFDSDDDPQVVRHSVHCSTSTCRWYSHEEQWAKKKLLGSGGFGSVFLEKCIDVTGCKVATGGDKAKTGRLRAVKRLQKPRNEATLSTELLRELNSLLFFSNLKYEVHFVKTFGWYESRSTLFIAMEYLPLGDMQSYILYQGRVPEEDAKYISKQVLRGLEFMHSNRFVHRDLKPANILIKTQPPNDIWWVKIADFGLSKTIEKSRSLTPTACGTLGFLAPELLGIRVGDGGARRLSQLEQSKAADMWAAGETIFQILTGTASFGGDMQRLCDYVQGRVGFPTAALRDVDVSEEGISFVCNCMDPSPSTRPSATFAIERMAWQTNVRNSYHGWKAKYIRTLRCKGNEPPFLLFTPTGDRLIVITRTKVYLWNLETSRVDNTIASAAGHDWAHASVSRNGRFLCVTEVDASQPPELLDATTLQYITSPEDTLDHGRSPKISTFSHDGNWLVTASDDMLCQMSRSTGWRIVDIYRGAITPSSKSSEASRNKSMAFTKGDNRLVAAYENKVVIKNTSRAGWPNIQVIDYPCSLSSVSVSPRGKLVACGSKSGSIWLWVSEMNCWKKRMVPAGGPDKIGPSIEEMEFSDTGMSMTYTRQDVPMVSLLKTLPLNENGTSRDLGDYHGRRVGRTVSFPDRGHGATALSAQSGVRSASVSSVVFWRYET